MSGYKSQSNMQLPSRFNWWSIYQMLWKTYGVILLSLSIFNTSKITNNHCNKNIAAQIPQHEENPCIPSPCGPNSQCKVQGESPACSCLLQFIGSPPNCKPECITNSECSYNLACLNMKCKDPCPGSCAPNAECHVISHSPMCKCPKGFVGDPFSQCTMQQGNFKLLFKENL